MPTVYPTYGKAPGLGVGTLQETISRPLAALLAQAGSWPHPETPHRLTEAPNPPMMTPPLEESQNTPQRQEARRGMNRIVDGLKHPGLLSMLQHGKDGPKLEG